jgi:hypothetical protein
MAQRYRSAVASTARFKAMAEQYAAREAAALSRSRAADAARYTAMAHNYAAHGK